jgi:predicted Zn-ribbon and HTH transcriptional regulator
MSDTQDKPQPDEELTHTLETDKTVCQNCDYEHHNTQESWIHLNPGDYCPKCATQFEDGDRFTEKEEIIL